jgi:aldehyde:ferredoxin oxidoreductase
MPTRPIALPADEGWPQSFYCRNCLWGQTLSCPGNRKGRGGAAIGCAGENLVRYAAVISDHDRAAARSEMWAVMGAKRLKAIAVHGHHGTPFANEQRVRELAKEAVAQIVASPKVEYSSLLHTDITLDMR